MNLEEFIESIVPKENITTSERNEIIELLKTEWNNIVYTKKIDSSMVTIIKMLISREYDDKISVENMLANFELTVSNHIDVKYDMRWLFNYAVLAKPKFKPQYFTIPTIV